MPWYTSLAMPLRPCLGCGKLVHDASRCAPCQTELVNLLSRLRPTNKARGYDSAWTRLSKAMITEQPWCSACGAVADLTVDHVMSLAAGGESTPSNLRVLCRRCHGKKRAIIR